MADGEWRGEEYSQLRDLRLSLDREGKVEDEGGGFSLCLWLYLSSSARPSSVIIRQMLSESTDEVPFLALNEENRLTLFPIMIHEGAPSPGSYFPCLKMPHISAEIDCPLEKWVHIGCKVARNYLHLYVNATLAGEELLSVLPSEHHYQDNLKKLVLVGNDGKDGKLQGYVYSVTYLPPAASVKDHFIKNFPVKLSLDGSCISDGIEEGGDGVWSIIGGKASCRRNFSLEVILLDALGQSVHKEMEITASLIYADSGAPVETTGDNEAPLLASCDGLEFPSTDRPVTLISGRATFKLKISQLSSKCDNRLFRVYFHMTQAEKYPFLEAYSPPIRCISRNRNSIRPFGFGKRPSSVTLQLEETQSQEANDGLRVPHDTCGDGQIRKTNGNELRGSTPFKRKIEPNGVSEQDGGMLKTSVELKSLEETDSTPSDSESTDARNSESRCAAQTAAPISDIIIFRYCLEGTYERSVLLRDIIKSSSNEDIATFADQVSLYAGCSHHRHQILMSRELIQEEIDTWNSISQNSHPILWIGAIPEINKKFMKIACSASRSLSGMDLEVLHGIAGCGEDLGQEHFRRMWYWLYPVAFALSKSPINELWACMTPRWIEGFITREDAENSLKGPRGLQKPGTFILRFPTSRSWPHPDAGNLVVSFVGADSSLHHKLLRLDLDADDNKERNQNHLQSLLLEEPELSQLGRVIRDGTSLIEG